MASSAITLRPRATRGGMSPLASGALIVVCGAFAAAVVGFAPGSPVLAVGAVLAIIGLVVAIAQPMWVVALGVLVIPLEGFFPGLVGPSQAMLGLAAVGWVVNWAGSRPLTLPRSTALGGFALLVVAYMAGLLFAPEPLNVARQVTTFTTLFVVATCITHERNREMVPLVLYAFALCGGLAGVVAVVDPQPLTGVVFQGGDVSRATGGLGSPNALGMLFVLALPVQIVFALRGPLPLRAIAAACAALAMLGMTLAVSRGAFIGLGVGCIVLAGWAPFRTAALVLVPLVVVLAIVGHNPASKIVSDNGGKVVERLSEVSQTGQDNLRLKLWKAAPRMISDHPLFGVGGLEYQHYAPLYGLNFNEGIPNHAHNLFLTITIEGGLVALLGFLMMLYGTGKGLVLHLRRATGLSAALTWAVAASLLGFVVEGMLDYAIGAAPLAAAFFVVVAAAIALGRDGGQPNLTARIA